MTVLEKYGPVDITVAVDTILANVTMASAKPLYYFRYMVNYYFLALSSWESVNNINCPSSMVLSILKFSMRNCTKEMHIAKGTKKY